MSPEFVRAQFLREHHRHEEAVALLHSHLARHPEDPDAFVELALNRTAIPGAEQLALADIRTASGLAPNRPFPLSVQARILSTMNRPAEARRLAEAALAMEPNLPYYWNTQSIVLCDLGHWKEAEQAARKALELDPDEATASNLLSLALRRRNLIHASEEESRRRLQRDPESAFPFSNLGQSALRKKHFAEAELLFLEALRLNPALQNGRGLLKEASQSRSWVFRWFMVWTKVWGEVLIRRPVVGIMVLVCAVPLFIALAETPPAVELGVSTVAYLTFFGTWLKKPFGDLVFLKSEHAPLLLETAERKEAIAIGCALLAGWLLAAIAAFTGSAVMATLGGGLWIACVPAIGVLTNPSKPGRGISAGLAVVFVGLTAYTAYALSGRPARGFDDDFVSMGLLGGYLVMIGMLLLRNPLGKLRLRSFLRRS